MRRCRSNSLIMFKRNGFVLGVGVLLHGAMASEMPQLSDSTSIMILASIAAFYFALTTACTLLICHVLRHKNSKNAWFSLKLPSRRKSYELSEMGMGHAIADSTDLVQSGRADMWRKLMEEQSTVNGSGPRHNGVTRHVHSNQLQQQLLFANEKEKTENKTPGGQGQFTGNDIAARLAAPSSPLLSCHSLQNIQREKVQEQPRRTPMKVKRSRTGSTEALLEAGSCSSSSWELNFRASNVNLMDDVLGSLSVPKPMVSREFGDSTRQSISKSNTSLKSPTSHTSNSHTHTAPTPTRPGYGSGTEWKPLNCANPRFVRTGAPISYTKSLPRPHSSTNHNHRKYSLPAVSETLPNPSHPQPDLRRSISSLQPSTSEPRLLISPIASTSYRARAHLRGPRGLNRAFSESVIPERSKIHTTAGVRVSEKYEEEKEEEEERGECMLETRMGREKGEEGGGVGRRPTWKQPYACVHPGEGTRKTSNFTYSGQQVTVTDL